MSADRNLLVNNGHHNPVIYSPRVELAIRGIKQTKQSSVLPRTRLPITPEILRRLKKAWNSGTYEDKMMWEAACLGAFGFLRCAEFTIISVAGFDPTQHLTLNDVLIVAEPMSRNSPWQVSTMQ